MLLEENNYLAHYGILRRSGRYPYGSGEDTKLQTAKTFLDVIERHKKVDGMSEAEIAKAYSTPDYPVTTNDIRALKSISVNAVKQDQIQTAQRLRDKGMGASAIARQMSTPEQTVSESTVRSLLEPGRLDKIDVLQSTSDMLKRQVEEKGFIDVGSSVEKDLPIGPNPANWSGVSPDKFKVALSLLKEEGYPVHDLYVKQVGTGDITRRKILTKPGVTKGDVWANRDNIRLISEKSEDRGHTWTDLGIKPPLSISSKRVGVKYKEDGGADSDGVIYVRPGVHDISLGKSRYAQVRVMVDDTHFLKGMAVYKDDLPKGVDLQFNTNKSNTGNKLDAMKELKRDKETGEVDKDNPFGAMIKIEGGQLFDSHGKVSSAMNIVNEEGDWDKWSKKLSPQVLSKQKPEVTKNQLDLTYERRRNELDKINTLTNPLIKRKLLETFGDETDAAAVHLKAVAMPNQATKVLLPSNHVKPTEIYAPTFKDGERVVLIRYPHAGTFEIPELTVNNRGREARKLLPPDTPDAVLIHPKVAERLSGADFDGDTVVVIPNNRGTITHTPGLVQLKGFDPQTYKVPLGPVTKKYPKGTPIITPARKQQEMGNITNLISDMTIKGAGSDELSRAVRHSMVVIDSEKHNLDYKRSAAQHGIQALKKQYQGVTDKGGLRGASTLVTRATSDKYVNERKAAPSGPGVVRGANSTIDVATGRKVYVDTGALNYKGKPKQTKSQKLAETDDAFTLVSEGRGTRIEQIYAEHSNKLKALANESRKDFVNVKKIPYSPSANKVYKHEVASLKSKLNIAEKNAPLERQAQSVANTIVAQKKRANRDMDRDEEKKIQGQALNAARLRTGAKKDPVEINDKEWEAIQAGAISSHMLEKVLNNSSLEKIRERATPLDSKTVTSVASSRARQMRANGYTTGEIAEALSISPSTVNTIFNGGGDNG